MVQVTDKVLFFLIFYSMFFQFVRKLYRQSALLKQSALLRLKLRQPRDLRGIVGFLSTITFVYFWTSVIKILNQSQQWSPNRTLLTPRKDIL